MNAELEFKVSDEELKLLFAESATLTPEQREEVAAAIRIPILQQVKDQSIARQLFATEQLGPGAQASYPVADDFEAPIFILPGLGYVPQNYIEGVGEEVFVPTFRVGTSFDWALQYARDSRIDVAQRAMRNAARTMIEYEEEAAWRVITPAVTTAFAGKGLLGPRPAPIVEIAGGPAAGFLSKELINQMIIRMKRQKRSLTDCYVSPEDMGDIREWSDSEVDPITRREIFLAGGRANIFGVQLHEVFQLGAVGKYNVNSNDSDFGIFRLSGGNTFNSYAPEHPNKVNAYGEVTEAGETQIYGFDLTSNDSLVMPIRQELKFWDDPMLHRFQKQGFYGWEEVGFACLDTRMMMMGIIDRYEA